MMYQRAISVSFRRASFGSVVATPWREREKSEESQQPAHDRAEQLVYAEKEHRQHRHHDRDEERRAHGFLARGPYHFGRFCADLADEFAGTGLRHSARPRILQTRLSP